MEQEVLKALKVLGKYCEGKGCRSCLFYSPNTNDSCLFHYNNPVAMSRKIKIEVETKEVYTWEGK